jgi:hypothetical protein
MFQPEPQSPNDLIAAALRRAGILGIGQEAANDDLRDGFQELNMMLAEWNTKRAHVFGMDDYAIQCTGARSYTIGPGGDFDIVRPDRIEAAYIRQNYQADNPVDFPLTILNSREDFARIGLKDLESFPSLVYYNPSYPLGELFVWPVPQAIYQLHIVTRTQLIGFSTPADTIALPPQYLGAILWNLAYRLCLLYRVDPGAVEKQAMASLNAIVNINVEVPVLVMPSGVRSANGIFNIYGDQYTTRGGS